MGSIREKELKSEAADRLRGCWFFPELPGRREGDRETQRPFSLHLRLCLSSGRNKRIGEEHVISFSSLISRTGSAGETEVLRQQSGERGRDQRMMISRFSPDHRLRQICILVFDGRM